MKILPLKDDAFVRQGAAPRELGLYSKMMNLKNDKLFIKNDGW